MTIQLKVVKSAMLALANGTASGSLETLGLLSSDLKLLCSTIPWKAAERNTVTRTLDILMYGTMDSLGLPRFMVPAEYVAATISMFVKPSNLMVACRWLEQSSISADGLGNPSSTTNQQPIDSSQLFSLVLQLADDQEVPEMRYLFEQRTQYAIQEATSKGVKNEKKL